MRKMEHKTSKRNFLGSIIPLVIVLAIALLILNNFMLYERGIKVAKAKVVMEEELRPAGLELVKLTSEDCDSCFDIEKAIDELKSQNVNVTSEETISSESQQGKELISKYNIKKLPTIIVSGEINKSKQLADYFEEKGEVQSGKFVYTSLAPPYVDVASNQIKGLVQITHVIDSSCEKCVDLTPISSVLEQQGLFIKKEQFIEYNSNEGRGLISKFDIKEIPAVLISAEVDYYPDIKEALIQSGAIKKEGFYAVHSTLPPYRDLAQKRIVGLVNVVYLTKNDCTACYNVSVNKNILLRFGVVLDKENTYDINSPEGQQFVKKYNLKKAPVIILSPDSEHYLSFVQAWKSVGTVESDGFFVMRHPDVIGTYWDLEKNILAAAKS
jgi:hypothetical protein